MSDGEYIAVGAAIGAMCLGGLFLIMTKGRRK